MRRALVLLLLAAFTLFGQLPRSPVVPSGGTGAVLNEYNVAGLPAPGTPNRVVVVNDAATFGSCTVGGGANRVYCLDTGALWVPTTVASSAFATTAGGATNGVTAASTLGSGAIPVGDGARGVTTSTLDAAVTKTTKGVPSAAAGSDIVGLFSGSGDYLKTDGTQGTLPGGDVTGGASLTAPNIGYLPVVTAAGTVGPGRILETAQSTTAPTIGDESLANGDFADGMNTWTMDPVPVVGVFVFTGSGLDDATAGGTSTYGGTAFTIEITANGTPDVFRWRRGTGAWTTGVGITGAAQTLSDGFTVTFAATIGHTIGDIWVSTVTSAWTIGVGGKPVSENGDEMHIVSGLGGSVVLVTVVVATASSDPGAVLSVSDDRPTTNLIYVAGTYSFIFNIQDDFDIAASGAGWELTSVSIRPYSSPLSPPIPSFLASSNGPDPFPFEVRHDNGNLGIGYKALENNIGFSVFATGLMAARNNTGISLVAIGNHAAENNAGSYVSALGEMAAENNTGNIITALGYNAAAKNSGNDVIAIGHGAAENNTEHFVTAIGVEAAQSNTGEDGVTAIGYKAAQNNTGAFVFAIGPNSAINNVGSQVLALGTSSAGANTGSTVLAIGGTAAENNTGASVTAVGFGAGVLNTGSSLTAIGNNSAGSKLAGDGSTFLGDGDVLTGTQKNIESSTILGAASVTGVDNSGGSMLTNIVAINGVATDSNQTVIGNAGTTSARIFGAPTLDAEGNVSVWIKYSHIKIANSVNGCTNAKGCWQINGTLGPNAATATSQVIPWLAAPSNAVLERVRWKTSTACAGLTAITLTDLGTTASASEFFTGGAYNLKTAVTDTNLLWLTLLTPGLTAAATNWSVTISGAVENIDDITDGCAFDIEAKWAVMP